LHDFLSTQLKDAHQYNRITGFFSSSLLEVAGEALEQMVYGGNDLCASLICNFCLSKLDIQTANSEVGHASRTGLLCNT